MGIISFMVKTLTLYMISLVEKLHLNRETAKTNIENTPLMASIKAKKAAVNADAPYYIARTPSQKYLYARNTEGYKVGDKLDDGSVVIEIKKPE